jgi:glycosyltransferase involved in cell wall biosynthesis
MANEKICADAWVSVIIPSYNHATFLRECVDSVLSQDHANTQAIVVDDGSTDGSIELLQSYGDRITLLQQRGGRQARARNLGLRVAKGELVAFLDSDDRYLPGRISSAVQAFRDAPWADVVWADYRQINAQGAVVTQNRWAANAVGDFRRELIASNPICNATVTLRRRVIDEIGGFDERVPRVCDGAAWYQIAARGRRFLHLDRVVLDYRLHNANDSASFVPMTRDRDMALLAAAQSYVRQGIISTSTDKAWLRNVLVRQFAFRAAAWVQRDCRPGWVSELQARFYERLGTDATLTVFARLQAVKRRLEGRGAQ